MAKLEITEEMLDAIEAVKGFPELIGKELQQWATDEYNKIKRRI